MAGTPGKVNVLACGKRAVLSSGKAGVLDAGGLCPACAPSGECLIEVIARSGAIPKGGSWDVTAYQGDGVATPGDPNLAYWRMIVVESTPPGDEGKWRAGVGTVSDPGALVGLVNTYSNWWDSAVVFELQVGCYSAGAIHWPGTIDPVTPWP